MVRKRCVLTSRHPVARKLLLLKPQMTLLSHSQRRSRGYPKLRRALQESTLCQKRLRAPKSLPFLKCQRNPHRRPASPRQHGVASHCRNASTKSSSRGTAGGHGGSPVCGAGPGRCGTRWCGRYISEEQVLGRFDAESGAWFRLAADEPLQLGNRLLSLPTYRPQILLSPNVKVTFSGDALATLVEARNAETPTLQMGYGRAVILSADSAATKIQVELPEHTGSAALTDAKSVLAIDVQLLAEDGADPLTGPRHSIVQLFASSGDVLWTEETGEQRIAAGEVLIFVDKAPGRINAASGDLTWIERSDASSLDLRASLELKPHLTLDRPLNLSLLERSEFRREEVRALACRCLSSLDVFEPILKALDDESQRGSWYAHFDALRLAVNRSQESAGRLLAESQKSTEKMGRKCFGCSAAIVPSSWKRGPTRNWSMLSSTGR